MLFPADGVSGSMAQEFDCSHQGDAGEGCRESQEPEDDDLPHRDRFSVRWDGTRRG